jgi:uncharacterized protein YecT (DUF1311 family)
LIRQSCHVLVVAVALFGAATTARAEEAEKGCDGNTYEMLECQKVQLATWDKRLNAAYQAALPRAQPKQREQLRVAQRQWLRFRDANCLYYDLGEGTIARLVASACMVDMTRARAEELERAIRP